MGKSNGTPSVNKVENATTTTFDSIMSKEPFRAYAWINEDAELIIYGSNDARQMHVLTIAALADSGITPGDEDWPEGANHRDFFEGLTTRWTTPRDDEQPFDRFTSWAPGRVPWAMADPYEYKAPGPDIETVGAVVNTTTLTIVPSLSPRDEDWAPPADPAARGGLA